MKSDQPTEIENFQRIMGESSEFRDQRSGGNDQRVIGCSQMAIVTFHRSHSAAPCPPFGRTQSLLAVASGELLALTINRSASRFFPMPLIQVRQSAVHGRGVFAARPIRKGRRIIEYTGRRVAWKSIPADVNGTHTFLFGINDGTDVIDPEIGGNEARWINHSCDPNCEAIEEDDGRVFIHALRNIRAGEELSYDYQLQVDEPITRAVKAESACHCGSSNCRGTMLDPSR